MPENFQKWIHIVIEEKKEKLLIIGASIGQLPLLIRAKNQGIHVTVATIPGDYVCLPLADDVIYCDIYDRDGIVAEAEKRKITAVTSDQNDLMNPTVAYVSEKLKLPGNRFNTVMSYCNKNQFRDLCEKAGIPVPKHVAVNSVEYDFSEFDCRLPWIVKPADSQSSIGVKKIDAPKELLGAVEFALSQSPTNSAIVEEFFPGKEIVCEGFVDEGKYYLLSFADRRYFDIPDLMIPSQTIFPSVISRDILDTIVDYESRLAAYTKPSFAIVHSEYLVNEVTGEIRIVESALRGGGVYISSDLIPLCTGIDINEILLNKARGIRVDVEKVFLSRKNGASAYICFYLPNGIIEEIRGAEELKSMSWVHRAYIDDIKVGDHTVPMTYKGARKGPILLKGHDREDIERNISKVQKMLEIYVRNPEGNVSGILWD